jgi:hypothetical protein
MTADIPSVLSKDGTDGLGAVPSVLEESRTDYRGRPSDGTVDNTAFALALNGPEFSAPKIIVQSRAECCPHGTDYSEAWVSVRDKLLTTVEKSIVTWN